MFFDKFFRQKDAYSPDTESGEVLISTKEILNQINNISDIDISEEDLRKVFQEYKINQEVISIEELEKLYNKIPNDILQKIDKKIIIDPDKGEITEKYFRVDGDSPEHASILNNKLNTSFSVNQHGSANGGSVILLEGIPAKVSKNNLLKLLSFKIVSLFDEQNN